MRLRRPPLPVSALVSGLLVLLPAALLLSFPRRSASGLDRLLPTAALLQSFRAQPLEPVPALWQQRLGPAAVGLWQGQRRLWWQFWGAHGDAGAYLVLPAPRGQALPAQALRVDDLAVLAPNPLARQLLVEQLKARRRPPRGLAQRCSISLQQSTAVFWNPGAVVQLLGPLAALAQELEQGCLVLNGSGRTLTWQGEGSSGEGPLTQTPPPAVSVAAPLRADQLLELQGAQLGVLLRGPLESRLLRQVLARTYGLGPEQIRWWKTLPFVLRLQAVPQGPFRAGLELEIQPKRAQRRPDAALQTWLLQLDRALGDQGLNRAGTPPQLTTWTREDGTLVGGWRWLPDGRLLLFLGPVPTRMAAPPPLESLHWRLRLQPRALVAAGLMPDSLPLVVRRAQQLLLQGSSAAAGGGSVGLSGQLSLP